MEKIRMVVAREPVAKPLVADVGDLVLQETANFIPGHNADRYSRAVDQPNRRLLYASIPSSLI